MTDTNIMLPENATSLSASREHLFSIPFTIKSSQDYAKFGVQEEGLVDLKQDEYILSPNGCNGFGKIRITKVAKSEYTLEVEVLSSKTNEELSNFLSDFASYMAYLLNEDEVDAFNCQFYISYDMTKAVLPRKGMITDSVALKVYHKKDLIKHSDWSNIPINPILKAYAEACSCSCQRDKFSRFHDVLDIFRASKYYINVLKKHGGNQPGKIDATVETLEGLGITRIESYFCGTGKLDNKNVNSELIKAIDEARNGLYHHGNDKPEEPARSELFKKCIWDLERIVLLLTRLSIERPEIYEK